MDSDSSKLLDLDSSKPLDLDSSIIVALITPKDWYSLVDFVSIFLAGDLVDFTLGTSWISILN